MQTRLYITKVNEGTLAKRVGCQVDDYIVDINGFRAVSNFDDVRTAVASRGVQETDLICYSVERDLLYRFAINPGDAGINFKAKPTTPEIEAKIKRQFDDFDPPFQGAPDSAGADSDEEEVKVFEGDHRSLDGLLRASAGDTTLGQVVAAEQQSSGESDERSEIYESDDRELYPQAPSHKQVLEQGAQSDTDISVAEDVLAVDKTLANIQGQGLASKTPQETATENQAVSEGDDWPDANVDIDDIVVDSSLLGSPEVQSTEVLVADGSADAAIQTQEQPTESTMPTAPVVGDEEIIIVGEQDDPEVAKEVRDFLNKTKTEPVSPAPAPTATTSAGESSEATPDQPLSGNEQSVSGNAPVSSKPVHLPETVDGTPRILSANCIRGKIPIVFGATYTGTSPGSMKTLGPVHAVVKGAITEELMDCAYQALEEAALKQEATAIVDCSQSIAPLGVDDQGTMTVLLSLNGTAIKRFN